MRVLYAGDPLVKQLESGEIPVVVAAENVTYDNTTSGLTADDVQEAIDEVAASVGGVEIQSGTLTAGQTSVALTFENQTIGADTLIDIYTDTFGVNPTAVSTTTNTVTLTFEVQASDVTVAVKVRN